ncbi:MAG: sigma-70 family RNA polymerase sigma factor, partial [Proteobacteria bacterium]|nr:sigma-70 family RNA polymerase sigma factor [Pseudomonadota bacterium]
MSYREIAGVLGKSEAGLKMSFSRTLKLLKKQMSESSFLMMILVPFLVD